MGCAQAIPARHWHKPAARAAAQVAALPVAVLLAAALPVAVVNEEEEEEVLLAALIERPARARAISATSLATRLAAMG